MGLDRRKFLAYIPSVSAVPFVAPSIITGEEKIEIIKPTPKEIAGDYSSMQTDDLYVELKNSKGERLGMGYVTSWEMHRQAPVMGGPLPLSEFTIEAKIYNKLSW